MTDQRAPRTPPVWFDAATGGETPPDIAARWVLDTVARSLRHAPAWLLETGAPGPVRLNLRSTRHPDRLIFAAHTARGGLEITLTSVASGWLGVTARTGEREEFRAWLDRPYEEFEHWPPHAHIPPRRTTEAPGRIGKRLNWINLSAEAWPRLAPLANPSGFVVATAIDP